MEYVIIGIVVVVLSVCAVLFWKRKKIVATSNDIAIMNRDMGLNDVFCKDIQTNLFKIHLEVLPADFALDETKLMEIKDSKVLARVNNLVPELFKAGTAAGNAIQESGQVLYPSYHPNRCKTCKFKRHGWSCAWDLSRCRGHQRPC